MRIVVDARELCGRPTGVGRYLSGLLDAWAASSRPRHEWILIAPSELPDASRWPFEVRRVDGSGGSAWEQFTLPRAVSAARADVFFAPGYTAPLTMPAPLVLTVHDVSYFAHPEWFSLREGVRRRLLTAWSARRARAVITDTQFSAAEIGQHIGLPAGKIRVIPLGLEPRATVSATREPMVLYAGSVFERRRVDRLIRSFDGVVARVPDARLEIVGENRTRRPHIDLESIRNQSAHPERIAIRSYVDDATLASLFARASVFAFMSEYEGFGLTPLEALAAGVPPVLLDTPVARETCGDAARYISPSAGDDEIAQDIAELLVDDRARASLLAHAESVLSRYDWARTAQATLAVLEEAGGGR